MKKSLMIAALLACSLAATAQPPPQTEIMSVGHKVDGKMNLTAKIGQDANEPVGRAMSFAIKKFDTTGTVAAGHAPLIVNMQQAGAVHDLHAQHGAITLGSGKFCGGIMKAFSKTTTGGAGHVGLMTIDVPRCTGPLKT